MTLEEYEELTGTTVPTDQGAFVTATIARTQTTLETLLGYTLNPEKVNENLYKELGKTQQECFCPSVNLENLQNPDEVVTAYRLYRFDELDEYFHVDPFTKLNAVKLVFIKSGDEPNGITLKTFDWNSIRVQKGRDGLARYIEHCKNCLCSCDCSDCVQLAVDAEWVWTGDDELPLDLQYVWSDMVTYYSDPKNSGIKSESIDTHSYTRFDNVKVPEFQSHNVAVIKKYAGPYGAISYVPTIGAKGRR